MWPSQNIWTLLDAKIRASDKDLPVHRDTWTPEREIPMPHMARRPLDEFEGGEFSTKPAGDFSCDESETEPEISSLYLQQHYRLRSSSVNIFYFNNSCLKLFEL